MTIAALFDSLRFVRTCFIFVGVFWLLACGVPLAAMATEEEFVGPFASWLDVRRDFGAVGDGKADDTAALQRSLDEIREHKRACVVYLPAGTYRITQTLKTARQAHQDNMVTIVGEDPARVVLKWDGVDDGTMLRWDAWYAKLSRLTFDGMGRAGTCVKYGPRFSTYNETSDLICRDAKHGIVFGWPRSAGQAENDRGDRHGRWPVQREAGRSIGGPRRLPRAKFRFSQRPASDGQRRVVDRRHAVLVCHQRNRPNRGR